MKSIKIGMSFIRAGSVVCLLRNEWHALIPSVCRMLVYRELTSIVVIVDSGAIRLLMSLSFLRKSSLSVIKQCILGSRCWRMESTHPEICSVCTPFEDTIGLYGGHMLRLVGLSISFVVLTRLPSVVCLLALVYLRWLS